MNSFDLNRPDRNQTGLKKALLKKIVLIENEENRYKKSAHKQCIRRFAVLLAAVFLLLLSGCGRSLVITTGFGRGEVFRIGNSRCKIAEVRVYMLDLQKESEALFGNAIWEGEDSAGLQEAVKEQALAQITRVKALNVIGVSRNVMLTTQEERLAEEAEHNYYAALSDAEIKYLGMDERNLQRMFREYALAEKTWKSLGDDAEQTYNEYYAKTQCDLNTTYWQKVKLKKVEGELGAPGFQQCYREMFSAEGEEQTDNAASGSTQAAEAEPEQGAEAAGAEEQPAQEPAAEQKGE